MVRLIVKKLPNRRITSYMNNTNVNVEENKETVGNVSSIEEKQEDKKKNKKTKKSDDMINEEQISAAELQASNLSSGVKVVKKDRGLIERTESSKIILTEDNRQVLND